jgi:hypothetical protein
MSDHHRRAKRRLFFCATALMIKIHEKRSISLMNKNIVRTARVLYARCDGYSPISRQMISPTDRRTTTVFCHCPRLVKSHRLDCALAALTAHVERILEGLARANPDGDSPTELACGALLFFPIGLVPNRICSMSARACMPRSKRLSGISAARLAAHRRAPRHPPAAG